MSTGTSKFCASVHAAVAGVSVSSRITTAHSNNRILFEGSKWGARSGSAINRRPAGRRSRAQRDWLMGCSRESCADGRPIRKACYQPTSVHYGWANKWRSEIHPTIMSAPCSRAFFAAKWMAPTCVQSVATTNIRLAKYYHFPWKPLLFQSYRTADNSSRITHTHYHMPRALHALFMKPAVQTQ